MPTSTRLPTVQPCTIAPMSNRDVVADRGGMGVVHDVDDRAVLHVRALADADVVDVAPNDGVHPDAAFGADPTSPITCALSSTNAVGCTTGIPAAIRTKHGRRIISAPVAYCLLPLP